MELVAHRNSFTASMLLHLALVLIAAFGLPQILSKKSEPKPLVMTVEILPITGVTNVKPSDKPIQEEKKANAATAKKPLPPAAKEPPKPVAKDEPKPQEKTPEKAEPLPSDKKDKPKEEKKKEEKKPDDFAALLNKLQQEAKSAKDAKDKTNTEENKTTSDAPYDPGLPLSLSELDAIRGQFERCWNRSSFSGAKDPHSLAVRLRISMQPDGTAIRSELVAEQRGRYAADSFFRAAADAAMRAVAQCSPLKNLPADKYNTWRELELNFDPADLL